MPSDPPLPPPDPDDARGEQPLDGPSPSPGGDPGDSPRAKPPPLPPPLPVGTGGSPVLAEGPVLFGRLHVLSLIFSLWNVVRGFFVPLIILMFLGRESYMASFLVVFIVIPFMIGVFKYFTFSYRIEDEDLITRQGVFSRTERHIPLARVQDIRIEQGVLHRLLRMADVHVDTASGRGAEATLSVLSRAEADRLRAMILQCKTAGAMVTGDEGVPEPEEECIRRLSLKDLVKAGMTTNHLASFSAIVAVAWGFLDDIIPQEKLDSLIRNFVEQASHWVGEGETTTWILLAAGSVAALLVGMLISIAGSILLFHGFTLSRRGEDPHRSYGLLTRRSSNLPRRRIQVLKIEEEFVRRLFRLATMRADTAGGPVGEGNEAKAGRDVMLPIVPREEVEDLLPQFFPDFDADSGNWRPVSRRAIWRGTFKGSMVCLVVAGIYCAVLQRWTAVWPLGLIPLIYTLNVMSYRHLGFWHGNGYFRTRRGWLSRAGHVVPVRNIQAVVVHQNPFDRRHGVGTIRIDSAGQVYTGGGPRVGNVPWDEVNTLARTLAHQAAQVRYRW